MNSLRRNATFFLLLMVVVFLAIIAKLSGFPPRQPHTPTPMPTPRVWIEEIRSIAELSTIEYLTVAEVPNEQVPDDIRKFFGAKEEILILVYGNVKAGFDLSKLSEDGLWVDGTRVQLTLPSPEILSISIDNERTHVIYYDKSWIVKHDIHFESKTRQIADETIRQNAIEAGILTQASNFGKVYFENHLRSLGFTDIRIYFK